MEGTLSTTIGGTTLLSITKTLRRSIAAAQPFQTQSPLLRSTTSTGIFHTTSGKFAPKSPVSPPSYRRLQCVSSSAGEVDDVSPLSSDVIVLDVRGMTCGGCSSSVKRILENQLQVSSANVNLLTATAIVWPKSEAKVTPNWQKVIGEELAKNLTNCGFVSNLRGEAATEGGPS